MTIVLDASVAAVWLFQDERASLANTALVRAAAAEGLDIVETR